MIHHGVDGVLQLQNLALDVDGDFFGQVTVSNSGSDFGDVTHLTSEVSGHRVHIVGQVFPGTGHAFYMRLAAEFALGTHLTRHAGDF